jgi:hypothetical protein
MLKTYTGSCHCGAIRFTVDLDLAAGTSKCNCSICRKTRAWSAIVKSINLGALDDVSDEELSSAPVRFMNGRDNAWFTVPRETRYL